MTKDMKWLCSARNRAHLEQVRNKLVAEGVPCELRDCPAGKSGISSYPELWVQANSDYHTASILYASPVRLLRQRSSGTGRTSSY